MVVFRDQGYLSHMIPIAIPVVYASSRQTKPPSTDRRDEAARPGCYMRNILPPRAFASNLVGARTTNLLLMVIREFPAPIAHHFLHSRRLFLYQFFF
jgi:hypothetical protein